jgi:hypothetical protein
VQRFGDSAHVVSLCGWVGATLVLAGVPGVLLCGAFLDATGYFHEVSRLLFALAALSMGGFSAAVQWGSMDEVFITAGAVGFFVTALVAAGFEFAAELTYPITVRWPLLLECTQRVVGCCA